MSEIENMDIDDVYLNIMSIISIYETLNEDRINELYILCKRIIEFQQTDFIFFNKKNIIRDICELIQSRICLLPSDKMLIVLMKSYEVPFKKEALEEFNLWINKSEIFENTNKNEEWSKKNSDKYNHYVCLVNCLSALNENDDVFEKYLARYKNELNQIKNYIKFLNGK